VSSVIKMTLMFHKATSFDRLLCGFAWVQSNAERSRIFEGSRGSISPKHYRRNRHEKKKEKNQNENRRN